MTEKKQPKPKEDDPTQSEAFRRAVRDLEAAGDLDRERGEDGLEAVLAKKTQAQPPSR